MERSAFSQSLTSPSRRSALQGEITFLTGERLPFVPSQVMGATISEGVNNGQLLGSALSASCTLTLYDPAREWTDARTPYGGQVRLFLAADETKAPLITFTVTKVSRSEGDGRLILTGSDALGTAFEGAFVDRCVYPVTLGQLAAAIADQAGFTLKTDFANAAIEIPEPPNWGEMTLRQALGCVAEAAGCFAVVARDGALELRPVWPDEAGLEVGPEVTLKREYGERVFGPLSGLSITLTGAPKDAEPLTVRSGEEALGENNCLALSGNPLLAYEAAQTLPLAQGMLAALQGMRMTRAQLSWRGDPDARLGMRLKIVDTRGEPDEILITRQTLAFSQGFSMQSDCTAQAGKTAVGRLFTPSGALNAAKLAGALDGALIRDGSLAARALTAGSVTALQLAAGAVTAEKLGAGSVTAEKLAADAVTADSLTAQSVTAEKLAAGAIEAEHLSADAFSALDAHLTQAEIDWAKIASLSAAIAEITEAKMATADVDWAHIKDLATDTAIITKGVGDELYIARLAVTEANLVSLTVGELLVRGDDGGFYALTVDESGQVSAVKKQVDNADVQDGSINAGEKLVEGSVTAACLNAQEIFADSAVIRGLIAANLDVDTLFAREATVAALNAADIRGNEYLRLYVGEQMEGFTDRLDAAESSISLLEGEIALKASAADIEDVQFAADTAGEKADANARDIAALTGRMNSAEQRITDESIIGTVKKSDVYASIQGMEQSAAQQQQLIAALQLGLDGKADEAALAEALAQAEQMKAALREMDSRLTQTADSLTFTLTQRLTEMEADLDGVRTQQTEMKKWIRFDENGLEIGSTADPARLRADNKQLEVPGIKTEKLTITPAMTEDAQWAWMASVSGLSLKWVW